MQSYAENHPLPNISAKNLPTCYDTIALLRQTATMSINPVAEHMARQGQPSAHSGTGTPCPQVHAHAA